MNRLKAGPGQDTLHGTATPTRGKDLAEHASP